MRRIVSIAAIALLSGATLVRAEAAAVTSPQQAPSNSSQATPKPGSADTSADSQEKPAQAQSPDAPADGDTSPAQDAAARQQKKQTTKDANPFPEDQSRKAAESAAPDPKASRQMPPAGDEGGSSSRAGADKVLHDVGGADLEGKPENLDTARAKEDVRVGSFYLAQGNYRGAYERYKDASVADPANAEAVFGLAESARKLNKHDEAVTNYQLFLAADPDGAKAKAARKALSELHASAKP